MRNQSLLPDIFEGMDRLFPDLVSHSRSAHVLGQCDVEESDEAFLLTLDVPGMQKSEIQMQAKGSELWIRGSRKRSEVQDDKRRAYKLTERSYGRFDRHFDLGELADLSKVEAQIQDGVLFVKVPKVPASQPRQIEIK